MMEEELRDALDGLYAYDSGATDSGIHDEALRQKCIDAMKAMPREAHEVVPRLWLSRLVRDMWLSENMLAHGYGIEDAFHFIKWLRDEMDVPL